MLTRQPIPRHGASDKAAIIYPPPLSKRHLLSDIQLQPRSYPRANGRHILRLLSQSKRTDSIRRVDFYMFTQCFNRQKDLLLSSIEAFGAIALREAFRVIGTEKAGLWNRCEGEPQPAPLWRLASSGGRRPIETADIEAPRRCASASVFGCRYLPVAFLYPSLAFHVHK